jgi:L-alanine-DL-glutamate epimerase-like enolase superfamily enzyme
VKIVRIDVFQVDYKLLDHKYSWSRGQSVKAFVSTVVKISTDEGITGYAEVCPLGSTYMEAYARGVPSGIAEIGPALLGQDPCQINAVYGIMDSNLSGHNYIKAPIDIACWDILGQAAGVSVATLLGGRCVEDIPLYRAISQGPSEQMKEDVSRFRAEGYRRFQLKVGGDPDEDIKRTRDVLTVIKPGDILVADANTGWIPRNAIRVVNALEGEDLYIEQPCISLEECLTVRNHTNLPMVLDEVIKGVPHFLRAHAQKAMDVINIKISRVGGLSKARQLRDLCQPLGIAMTLEDSWGGDITTAAIAHLAGSTMPEFHFTSTDFNSYNDYSVTENPPRREEGRLKVPDGPGLGIKVDEKKLGEPVLTVK